MINWHNIAKKATKKWRRDGKLPRQTIGHYINYTFDHISYIDGLGFYVSSRIENRHLKLEEVARGQLGLKGFGGISIHDIVTEIWPDLSDEEKVELMANTLSSHA